MARLRLSVTVFCALILLCFYGLFIVSYWILPLPARVSSPERALAHVVSNAMILEAGSQRTSGWKHLLPDIMDPPASHEETFEEAIHWHEELLTISKDPVAQVHLAILQAEAGQQEKVRAELAQWRSQPEPFPTLADLVKTAYLENNPIQEQRFWIEQAVASELLPADWFQDRLTIQLAARSLHPERAAQKERGISLRAERLFRRHFLFTLLDLCLMLAGGAACVVLFRLRKNLTLGQASIPPPWSGSIGIAVLLRGGAWGVLLIALSFFVESRPLVQTALLPVVCLPVLLLAQKHLLRPTGLPLHQALGLSVDKKRLRLLLCVVIAGMAIEVVGNALLGIAGNLLHLPNHWTEWFDADLAWGGPMNVASSLFQSVVIAPVFEEAIFRGLLFTTLRRRFNWVISALISAGVFGLAHGYGILGFLTVFVSGVIWAWMLEKTRSLIPGILAHAADNLIFTTGALAMFRGA